MTQQEQIQALTKQVTALQQQFNVISALPDLETIEKVKDSVAHTKYHMKKTEHSISVLELQVHNLNKETLNL